MNEEFILVKVPKNKIVVYGDTWEDIIKAATLALEAGPET